MPTLRLIYNAELKISVVLTLSAPEAECPRRSTGSSSTCSLVREVPLFGKCLLCFIHEAVTPQSHTRVGRVIIATYKPCSFPYSHIPAILKEGFHNCCCWWYQTTLSTSIYYYLEILLLPQRIVLPTLPPENL